MKKIIILNYTTMKKFNLVVVFVLGCIFAAFSQVPGAFNYQAVVRNSSGDIIANASVSFRVSILQNSETGSPVYVETQHTTTNSFGLVSLKIGQGTVVSGNLENAAWDTAPHFIKVEVDPAGGSAYSLLGTSELLSVPYALQAENVSNDKVNDADADPANELQSISLSGTVLTLSKSGGSVTLPSSAGGGGDNWGTQNVVTDATLSGNGTTASPLSVVGDLSDNQTLSVSGNELSISDGNTVTLPASGSCLWTQNGNFLSYPSGTVQIGTIPITDEGVLLDVRTPNKDIAFYAENNNTNATIQVRNLGTGGAAWFHNKIKISDGSQGCGKVLTSDADGNSTWETPPYTPWTKTNSKISYTQGNVGIGIIPDSDILLDVYSESDYKGIRAQNTGYSSTIHAENHGAGAGGYFSGKTGAIFTGRIAGLFYGNVRIIDGTEGAGKVLTSDGDGETSWQTPASGSSLWTASGDNIYRSSGFVGIGTDSPVTDLHINNSADAILKITSANGAKEAWISRFFDRLHIASKDKIYFGTNGQTDTDVVIDHDGNVGIGTTSPTQKLDVNGNINLSSGADRSIGMTDGTKSLFVGGIKDQPSAYSVHIVTNSASGGVARLSVVADKVGIGTLPTQTLDVNGNVRVRAIGSGAYSGVVNRTSDGTLTTASSDIRLKENISTLNNSLEKVLQLRGVNFTWKSNPEYGQRIGFIAQEFEKVIPELVFTNETDGYKGINYAEVTAVLVEAMKEQQKQITVLSSKNTELEARLSKLEEMLVSFTEKK